MGSQSTDHLPFPCTAAATAAFSFQALVFRLDFVLRGGLFSGPQRSEVTCGSLPLQACRRRSASPLGACLCVRGAVVRFSPFGGLPLGPHLALLTILELD